jgi:Holliday junction resolvasome RuvABC ATP-dependent DNA helicase subunit
LAAIVGEEVGTVEEEIEPWLIACGMVKRAAGGGREPL